MSKIEYNKGSGSFYNVVREGFFVGKILILDNNIYFNPDPDNSIIDFDIEEMQTITNIMADIKKTLQNCQIKEDKQ